MKATAIQVYKCGLCNEPKEYVPMVGFLTIKQLVEHMYVFHNLSWMCDKCDPPTFCRSKRGLRDHKAAKHSY